jgi:hypothetical protein
MHGSVMMYVKSGLLQLSIQLGAEAIVGSSRAFEKGF